MRRSDRGTSLIEVMVTVSLLSVAMAGTFDVFSSVLRADHRNEAAVESRHRLSQTVAEVVREVRSASVMTAPSTSGLAAEVLEVGRPDGKGGTTWIRFSVEQSKGVRRLVRSTLDRQGGSAVATRVVLAQLESSSSAVFRYFEASGDELIAGVERATTIAGCSLRVRVSVTTRWSSEVPAVSATADAAFRNVRPEDVPC